ncbi:hypothetical protein RhiirB3_388122 [Rhizophagus irregularis]|nr:hypothetical protein RhiirB3_388122 [Rhizophagus irregularis]
MKWWSLDRFTLKYTHMIVFGQLRSQTKERTRTISENPAHSILTPIGCKAFKLIQDRGICKLITYYESWADLDKTIGKAFSLNKFTGDWKRVVRQKARPDFLKLPDKKHDQTLEMSISG